jgi:16S rRNA (guanine527-N7)-methyltransferase
LQSVTAQQICAEKLTDKYDYVISCAIIRLPEFIPWVRKKIARKQIYALPNGVLYLIGGELQEETKSFKKYVFIKSLSDWFEEEFFETKKVVHLPV